MTANRMPIFVWPILAMAFMIIFAVLGCSRSPFLGGPTRTTGPSARTFPFSPVNPKCNYIEIMERHMQLLAMGQPI